jgi:DNA repair protein RecO (recombination protein O)
LDNIQGIILKKLDYKESSKIIYLYTKEGLKSVLIHGSNKLKSPYLSLTKIVNHVDLQVSGKELLTLRDGDIICSFQKISNDLEKYTYVSHVLEIIYSFATHEHDHEKLYNFLVKILNLVENNSDYIPYLNMVEIKLTYLLGVNPLFNHCTSCDKTSGLYFSVVAGGMCCEEHMIGQQIVSNKAVEGLAMLYYFDINKDININLDPKLYPEIRLILDKYFEYHLNFKSNSRKMLFGLIGY